MTDIQFYHLLSTPLERALPKLLEKAADANLRTVVLADSEEKVQQLNQLLWTYNPNAFLPHGSAKDGNKEHHPIYLTHTPENPNQAQLLVVTDGSALESFDDFTRVLDIFDGTDDAALQSARARWKAYGERGHALTYIKQTEKGGWQNMGNAA